MKKEKYSGLLGEEHVKKLSQCLVLGYTIKKTFVELIFVAKTQHYVKYED